MAPNMDRTMKSPCAKLSRPQVLKMSVIDSATSA